MGACCDSRSSHDDIDLCTDTNCQESMDCYHPRTASLCIHDQERQSGFGSRGLRISLLTNMFIVPPPVTGSVNPSASTHCIKSEGQFAQDISAQNASTCFRRERSLKLTTACRFRLAGRGLTLVY